MARSSGAVALPQRPANLAPGDKDRVVPLVDFIAAQWSVSQPMVAYRLHRLGWITPSLYSDLCSSYAARWHATKQREKEKNKEKEGGPTYYTMRQYSLGRRNWTFRDGHHTRGCLRHLREHSKSRRPRRNREPDRFHL